MGQTFASYSFAITYVALGTQQGILLFETPVGRVCYSITVSYASFIASGSHFTTALRSMLRLLSSAAPAAR